MVKDRDVIHVPFIAEHEVTPQLLDDVTELARTLSVVHLFYLHEVHAVVVLLKFLVYLYDIITFFYP